MKWHIASVSWGKDSLAMLLTLIAKGYPLNEVVFYDTGMEFEAIYHTRDQMLPRLEQLGIKYTRLEPENPFLFDMLERPVCSKQKGTHQGYGWCGGLCRWGTTGKLKAIDRYAEARDAMVYVGIAADETPRLEKERKPYKLHPLAEWGMTEADALAYCYETGFRGWRARSAFMTCWTVFRAGAAVTRTCESCGICTPACRNIGSA